MLYDAIYMKFKNREELISGNRSGTVVPGGLLTENKQEAAFWGAARQLPWLPVSTGETPRPATSIQASDPPSAPGQPSDPIASQNLTNFHLPQGSVRTIRDSHYGHRLVKEAAQ